MTISGGPLDNQTWQTEWNTAPLAKVQLCEYKNKQTLEAFVAASCLYAKFDCLVACQNFSPVTVAAALDCETGLLTAVLSCALLTKQLDCKFTVFIS